MRVILSSNALHTLFQAAAQITDRECSLSVRSFPEVSCSQLFLSKHLRDLLYCQRLFTEEAGVSSIIYNGSLLLLLYKDYIKFYYKLYHSS
jgi:hypothetical protein